MTVRAQPTAAGSSTRARFDSVALPHLDSIYRIACRMTRRTDEAEDLVQETYFRAFRSFHQFREGSNCRAWLCTILSHLNVDRGVRSADRLDRYRLGGLEHLLSAPAERRERSGTSLAYSEFVSDDMKRAMDATPEVFKTPLLLSALGDKSYMEISTMLGCPMGTVMSRIHRARKHVRKCLQACRGT